MDHDCLVVLRHGIKCLLDDVAAKRVHGEVQSVTADCLGYLDDLLRGSMLEAALDKKVAEPIDHQGIGLGDDGFHDVVLLLRRAYLQLLLQKDGGLLIIVANNLVHNVFPVASNIAVQEAAIIKGLRGREVGLTF